MGSRIGRGLDGLVSHYMVACLFLALFILTLTGVGNAVISSMLGLILCAAGVVQRSAKADLWVLVPLILYNLLSMASSYAAYGDLVEGFAPAQVVFPVIYLLMACLDGGELRLLKQLCAAWAGAVAVAGIGQFVYRAVALGSARRLSGLLGSANAAGIFLVVGWFALLGCAPGRPKSRWEAFLLYLEPVLLVGAALTLSMGSFLAMAAGLLAVFLEKKRGAPFRDAARAMCPTLAKAVLAMGSGILMYLAAGRTDVPWVCLLPFFYAVALAACWRAFSRFLQAAPRAAAVISILGVLVAAAAVLARPSAAATFTERLEMMRNGFHYLTVNPLLGVGPYRWRILNLYDSDKYFNTWHIHNVLLHVGVELGWIAAALLVLIVARFYRKRARSDGKGGFTAFLVHNLLDTSFFYLGITSLVMMTAGGPQDGGKPLGAAPVRILFGAFGALCAYDLFRSLWAA